MALRSQFPQYVGSVMAPIGRGLSRTGIQPNTITTLGLVLTAGATAAVTTGEPVIGGWILVAGGLMDTLDGAVARATGTASAFGGFYDSVTDRISDGLILGGMAWWLRDQPRLFALVLVALVAAEVTSYVRAKAESIDLDCSVGLMERAERAILLMVGLIFHRWLLEPMLWILAVGGTVTVVQRIHHVWCQIARDLPEELVALMRDDRAWSRAFKRAARTFYGAENYQHAQRQAQGVVSAGDGQVRGPKDGQVGRSEDGQFRGPDDGQVGRSEDGHGDRSDDGVVPDPTDGASELVDGRDRRGRGSDGHRGAGP